MLCLESYRWGHVPTATGSTLKMTTLQNKELSGAERHFDVAEYALSNHAVPTSQKADGLLYKKKCCLWK